MKRTAIVLTLALFTLLIAPNRASADTRYTFILKKQEIKARHRWSLSEWLEQRDRMRMMDIWLALHSPSPFEFYIGGAYQFGRLDDKRYYGEWDIHAAAYASIAGIELQRQFSSQLANRWLGLLHLRLLGYYSQATNFTLQGGAKHEERQGSSLWNPLAGASLTLYLNRQVGIELLYRHQFATTVNGFQLAGDRAEGGAFLDFRFVRVYGNYFYEIESGTEPSTRQGGVLGTRLYF